MADSGISSSSTSASCAATCASARPSCASLHIWSSRCRSSCRSTGGAPSTRSSPRSGGSSSRPCPPPHPLPTGLTRPLTRLTKGTHSVVPRATEQAHVLFAKRDGRLFFVLPWNGYTMVGTTDTDYDGDPGEAAASSEDVDYLRTEAARAF